MLRRLLIISVLFLALPMLLNAEDQKARIKGPINITSETLTTDNKAHTALFENNVVARTTDLTIYSDKMLVYYKEDGGTVTKIEATGNVKVIKEARIITSKSAIYYADEDKVDFTGEPRAMDGDNVVSGTKITYFIGNDRFHVENSKVMLKSKKDR